MARWTLSQTHWTPTAVADATNFTDAGYLALQGGSSTQRINIYEVRLGGLASASAPTETLLARDSTIGATSLSGGLLTAHDPSTAALAAPPVFFNTSSTKPKRSATLQLIPLGFNAFGSAVRVQLPPTAPIGLLGTGTTFGEVSISSLSTGTPGLIDSYLIIEPL